MRLPVTVAESTTEEEALRLSFNTIPACSIPPKAFACGFSGQPQLPRNRASGDTFFAHTRMRKSLRKIMTLHFLSPPFDAYDAAVDDAIATCNGDLRGALKALIVANEFLERDLQKALASYAAPSIADNENTGLRHVNWTEPLES
jgi:hypothetical protein